MSRNMRESLGYLSYAGAAVLFFSLRLPLLPLWWPDFHSDYALVGLMAQHTKEGHFPIYFYGQNYMGGLEWLTAALVSFVIDGSGFISQFSIRANSLAWWFAAGISWMLALRSQSRWASHVFAWVFAAGSFQLLQVSVLQELSPQYLFFGGALFLLLSSGSDFSGRNGILLGFLLGLAWWANQSVVFFFLPALVIYQAIPNRWIEAPLMKELIRPVPGLHWVYRLWLLLALIGVVIAIFGGLRLGPLKIPNGMSLARDATLVVLLLHFLRKFAIGVRKGTLALFLPFAPFCFGALVGYAPVWLGRVFGFYEKGYGVGLAILPYWEWAGQLRALGANIAYLLFSFQWGPVFGLAVALAIGASGAWARFPEKARQLFLYGASVVAFNAVYVFFSDRAFGAPLRYLYPVWVGIALVAASLLITIRPVGVKIVCSILLVASFAHAGYRSKLVLEARAYAEEDRRRNLEWVAVTLEANPMKTCWGDYWTSYLMAFLTEERVILAPHPSATHNQVRVSAYQRRVEGENPNCFVFEAGEGEGRRLLITDRNPWVER